MKNKLIVKLMLVTALFPTFIPFKDTVQAQVDNNKQVNQSSVRNWKGSNEEGKNIPIKKGTARVNNKTITETNIKKLNPYLSAEEIASYSETLSNVWSKKEIRQVLYYSTEGYQPIVSNENYDNIDEIKIIYADESFTTIPLQESGKTKVIEGLEFPILERENVGDESSESYQYLLQYFKEVKLDEILEAFGGRKSYDSLFPELGSEVLLGELQIGNNREIDSTQLDEIFEELQENPEKTVMNILYAFPELTETVNMTSEEKGSVLNFVQENREELIFTYAYLKRWFNYEVGNVPINEIIYGNASSFSVNQDTSNLDILQNIVGIFKSESYLISSYYIDYVFFTSSSSLMQRGKGFDIKEIKDENNMYTMGSFIEYFIRIYEGRDKDYNEWFKKQGFVIGEADIDENVKIENFYLPTWEAFRSFESRIFNESSDMSYRSTSGAFLTILLSVSDKGKISISNGANGIAIGNATLFRSDQKKSAEDYAQQYAEDQTRFMEFLWNQNSTENDRKVVMQLEADGGYHIRYDAGERVDGEEQKDVYSTDSTYLHYYLMAASPQSTSFATATWLNGIVDYNNTLVMGVNPLSAEYTTAHEVTHVYQHLLNNGHVTRLDFETTAGIAQTDEYDSGWLSLNYYFEAENNTWNSKVPNTVEELKNYAQGYLDVMYAWNIEKAKVIFSMNLDEQIGRVYQGDAGSMTAKQLTKSEIEELEINVNEDDFLKKLIEYNIILPANTKNKEITYSEFLSKYDAFFFVPYLEKARDGEKFRGDQVWIFEALVNNGMDGYVDFVTTKLSKSDVEIIQTFTEDNLLPKEYLLQRYKEVEEKVSNDQLKLYTSEELKALVTKNINNDQSAKIHFLYDYMKRTNDFFEGIYKKGDQQEEIIEQPTVNVVTDEDVNISGKGVNGSKIHIFIDGLEIGNGLVDGDGKWSISMEKQVAGTQIMVTQSNGEVVSESVEVTVELTKPTSPVVNEVYEGEDSITGIGKAASNVIVTAGQEEIGGGEVDEDGNFEIDILPQQAGIELSVVLSNSAGDSNPTKVKVKRLEYVVTSVYKLSYWRNYGFVLEGIAGLEGVIFETSSSVEKMIEIVNGNGEVVQKIVAVNTKWYDAFNYDGYQAIITNDVLGSLAEGSYKIQVRIEVNGKEYVTPITEQLVNTRNWIGGYRDSIADIETGYAHGNQIQFGNMLGQMTLSVISTEREWNPLADYKLSDETRVIDAWMATDYDYSQEHTKELVVKDNSGNEVYSTKVSTWNIKEVFKLQVKAEWERSGVQVMIAPEYQKDGHACYVVIKDASENKVVEVEIKF